MKIYYFFAKGPQVQQNSCGSNKDSKAAQTSALRQRTQTHSQIHRLKQVCQIIIYNWIGRCPLCGHFLDAGACFAIHQNLILI